MPPKAEPMTRKRKRLSVSWFSSLDDSDIQILKTYGQGPYSAQIKKLEQDIKETQKRIAERMGVKESDTGLAPPNLWDIP
ncbi:hypothetical protein AG1IA_00948 [Rhizoctonia solani AG-1 IA]|uniref:Uncharacterized protein n=1 Tax=Thanatephorus cucumeris (strain AG1-IA) TaxID=983506 RepID=L8X8Q0_THACA|nr:hypothetical protein AG1IA_00948 [Rhizoctonia solani AG-1 IA]